MAVIQFSLAASAIIAVVIQGAFLLKSTLCKSIFLNASAEMVLEKTVNKPHLTTGVRTNFGCSLLVYSKNDQYQGFTFTNDSVLRFSYELPSGLDYEH